MPSRASPSSHLGVEHPTMALQPRVWGKHTQTTHNTRGNGWPFTLCRAGGPQQDLVALNRTWWPSAGPGSRTCQPSNPVLPPPPPQHSAHSLRWARTSTSFPSKQRGQPGRTARGANQRGCCLPRLQASDPPLPAALPTTAGSPPLCSHGAKRSQRSRHSKCSRGHKTIPARLEAQTIRPPIARPCSSTVAPLGSCQGWRGRTAPAGHTSAPTALPTAPGQGAAPAPGQNPPPHGGRVSRGVSGLRALLGETGPLSPKSSVHCGVGGPSGGQKEGCRTAQRLGHRMVPSVQPSAEP